MFQETLDFVAYVAKDEVMGRACHVLECGGGLSEDVITTIGQAFELRFKDYLKKQPKPVHVPHRLAQFLNVCTIIVWNRHEVMMLHRWILLDSQVFYLTLTNLSIQTNTMVLV